MYLTGVYGIEKGVGSFFEDIADIIKENGGTILTSSPVGEILMEAGEVIGCRLVNGQVFHSRAVIATNSPQKLYGSMLPNVDNAALYAEKLNLPKSSSAIHLTLGVSNPLSTLAGGYYVVLPDSWDTLKDWYLKTEHREKTDEQVFWVYISKPNMSMAPEGQSLIQLVIPIYSDVFKSYTEMERQKLIDSVINRLEEWIPEIRENIVFRDQMDPLWFEEVFGIEEGAVLAYHGTVPFGKRPRKKCLLAKGLYLSGQWAFNGGIPAMFKISKAIADMVITDRLNE